MRIGELSERTGASVRSLRYYEECGLIGAHRSPSGQRHYGEDVVARVAMIRRLLAVGLTTSTIAEVMPCLSDPSVQTSWLTARLMAERDRLTAEIAQRATMRDELQRIIDASPPVTTR